MNFGSRRTGVFSTIAAGMNRGCPRTLSRHPRSCIYIFGRDAITQQFDATTGPERLFPASEKITWTLESTLEASDRSHAPCECGRATVALRHGASLGAF